MKSPVHALMASVILPLTLSAMPALAVTAEGQVPAAGVPLLPMPAVFGPLTLQPHARHVFDVDRSGGDDAATLVLAARRGQKLSGTLSIVDPDTGAMRRQLLLDGLSDLTFHANPLPEGGRDRYILQAGGWPMTLRFSLVDRHPVLRNGRAHRHVVSKGPLAAMIRPGAGKATVSTWGGNGGATLRVYEWRAGHASRQVCNSVGDSWRQCEIDSTGQTPYLVVTDSDVADLKVIARW